MGGCPLKRFLQSEGFWFLVCILLHQPLLPPWSKTTTSGHSLHRPLHRLLVFPPLSPSIAQVHQPLLPCAHGPKQPLPVAASSAVYCIDLIHTSLLYSRLVSSRPSTQTILENTMCATVPSTTTKPTLPKLASTPLLILSVYTVVTKRPLYRL